MLVQVADADVLGPLDLAGIRGKLAGYDIEKC